MFKVTCLKYYKYRYYKDRTETEKLPSKMKAKIQIPTKK